MAKRKRPSQEQINKIARNKFGYESLISGQEAAINAILDRKDTLAVMPTGSGKSAIYQIAGNLINGTTIVLSPLLALQQDQVESIQNRDPGGAAVVNYTITTAERKEAFEDLEQEEIEFYS